MTRTGQQRYEKLVALAGLAVTTGAVIPLLRSHGTIPLDQQIDDPWTRTLLLVIYGVAAIIVLSHASAARVVLARQKFLVAVVLLAMVSTVWSDAPSLTFRRSAALLLAALFAVFLATRFDPRELLSMLGLVMLAVGLVSLAFVLFYPGLGLDHARADAWRGAFATKNELGRMMTLAALVWSIRFITRSGPRWLSLSAVALSLWLVHKSDSRTALVALVAVSVVLAVLHFARKHRTVAVPAIFGVVLLLEVAAVIAMSRADRILGALGANSTFTGRTAIWSAAWSMAKERFWFGYGYSAFWRGVDGPSIHVWSMVNGTPPHSHNGFLDLWLDLGAVGVCLIAAALFSSLVRAISAFRRDRNGWAIFALVFLSFLVVFNITESSLVARNSIFWVLFVCVSCVAARETSVFVHVDQEERDYGTAVGVLE